MIYDQQTTIAGCGVVFAIGAQAEVMHAVMVIAGALSERGTRLAAVILVVRNASNSGIAQTIKHRCAVT